MPTMVSRKCKNCGNSFEARTADVKRGWGNYCSKSCKASKQEKRTGQYANFLHRQYNAYRGEETFLAGGFSNEEYDCNSGPEDRPNW